MAIINQKLLIFKQLSFFLQTVHQVYFGGVNTVPPLLKRVLTFC